MEQEIGISIGEHFAELEDPRIERTKPGNPLVRASIPRRSPSAHNRAAAPIPSLAPALQAGGALQAFRPVGLFRPVRPQKSS